MKHKTLTLSLAMTLSAFGATAQSKAQPYFGKEEMPDLLKWLPAPPDSTSLYFARDVGQYMWGKEQRLDSVRLDIAVRDAVYGLQTVVSEFSEPFGLQISETGTPEIYALLRDAIPTCNNICSLPKRHYQRRRPFMVFNEPTATPDDEVFLRPNGSYPSGHTIMGWGVALILMEINPERADTILARGMMYGDSRVIVGAHWQSDVDAGRLAASAAYAKLHTSERFLEQLQKAKKEFAEKTRNKKK